MTGRKGSGSFRLAEWDGVSGEKVAALAPSPGVC